MASNKLVSRKAINITILLTVIILVSSFVKITTNTEFSSITYEYFVDNNGDATVKILIKIPLKEGASWIYVPNNISWSLKVIQGEIVKSTEVPTDYLFYNNYSYHFLGPLKLKIEYFFTYASLIGRDKALFFSPLVYFDGKLQCTVKVYLPPTAVLLETDPGIYLKESTSSHLIIQFSPIRGATRIKILYRTKETKLTEIRKNLGIYDGKQITVTILTHPRYKSIAQRIVETYKQAYPLLRKVFHVDLRNITIWFKVPTIAEIGVMGYVPLKAKKLGDIYLNILWIRTKRGFFEQIALHELTHHFLWRAGVNPYSLLWFHEGCADYFSVKICLENLKLNGAYSRHKLLLDIIEDYFRKYGKNIGFIQHWTVWSKPKNIQLYYAASYYIVLTLGIKYGNLTYYSRVFKKIREAGGVDSNNELIEFLSEAAESDLSEMFLEWGFYIIKSKASFSKVLKIIGVYDLISEVSNPFTDILVRRSQKEFSGGNIVQALYYTLLALIAEYPASIIISAIIIIVAITLTRKVGDEDASQESKGAENHRALHKIN